MVARDRPQVRRVARSHRADGTRESKKRLPAPVPVAGRRDFRSGRSLNTQRVLSQVKALADTGFLVVFGNRNDRYHAWALELAQQVTEPLLTCDAVLAEAAFHLGSAALVLAFVRDGLVRPALVVAEHVARLAELASRYADRRPDLADLCLIRLSELHPKYPLITTDLGGFRVYRRGRREVIPLIHPPEP